MGACCGCCCSNDALPGGGEYERRRGPRRSELYDHCSVSGFNSEAHGIFDRLSRTSTFHGVDAREPTANEHAFKRSMALCYASCINGVTADPEQFADEIKESVPELRQRDIARVAEWVDQVIEFNRPKQDGDGAASASSGAAAAAAASSSPKQSQSGKGPVNAVVFFPPLPKKLERRLESPLGAAISSIASPTGLKPPALELADAI